LRIRGIKRPATRLKQDLRSVSTPWGSSERWCSWIRLFFLWNCNKRIVDFLFKNWKVVRWGSM